MKTTLTPEQLTELHTAGQVKAGRFVDPHTIACCKRILAERGRDWASSVLMRDLTRNSASSAEFPWLRSGEEETLVLADDAEWAQLTGGLNG